MPPKNAIKFYNLLYSLILKNKQIKQQHSPAKTNKKISASTTAFETHHKESELTKLMLNDFIMNVKINIHKHTWGV